MASELRAVDVFTPGAYPDHTYVNREEVGLERRLSDGLDTAGMLVSISGPSKSGKTVLVERVVTSDLLIPITGAGINDADDIWDRVLDWMGSPTETSIEDSTGKGTAIGVEGAVEGNVPLLGKGRVAAGASRTGSQGKTVGSRQRRRGMTQVVKEIGGSEFVVLLDDFHYIPRDVQAGVAQQLKEAIRQGVKVVTAAVPHRGDDVVRANADLRGRVIAVDVPTWTKEELVRIAELGFSALGRTIDATSADTFATEAAGSPQLMQHLCLTTCRQEGIDRAVRHRMPVRLDREARVAIYRRAAETTDFRSITASLSRGPKVRGSERKVFSFTDGSEGDVYGAILRALALDPPSLTFPYAELKARVARACGGEAPSGSSIQSSCAQLHAIAESVLGDERVLEWSHEDPGVLDIIDPYFLFHLRWGSDFGRR